MMQAVTSTTRKGRKDPRTLVSVSSLGLRFGYEVYPPPPPTLAHPLSPQLQLRELVYPSLHVNNLASCSSPRFYFYFPLYFSFSVISFTLSVCALFPVHSFTCFSFAFVLFLFLIFYVFHRFSDNHYISSTIMKKRKKCKRNKNSFINVHASDFGF